MKKTLTILILLSTFLISWQTKAEDIQTQSGENINEFTKVGVQPHLILSAEPTRQDINSKIGIVDGDKDDICFRTKNGDLKENTPVSIITLPYESPQKVLNAKVKKKLEEKCSRRASETTDKNPGENFYYSLTLAEKITDKYLEVFGIGIINPDKPVQIKGKLATIDLNNDGKDEFFRRCAGNEGILLAIWTGQPFKGKQIWHSFYYLDYDTEPNCKKKDSESIDDEMEMENDER